MLDNFTAEAQGILSITIGGVSLGAILVLTLFVVRALIANRKEIALRKEDVEKAFKEAILPKNIKLDVSGKIVKPIKEGLSEMNEILDNRMTKTEDGLKLVLTVLSKFSHIQKLPPEIQEQIAEYIDLPAEEITL